MESYRLNSRFVEDNKEFLVQTINDSRQGVIRTTLFVDGEFLDSEIVPHSEEISEDQILEMVKNAHGEKKSELEYLLKSYRDVLKHKSPEMMYQLGAALYYKRMYDEAIRLFKGAIKIDNTCHEAYYYLCQGFLARGNYEEAAAAGVRAAEIKPNYADYRNALGEAYLWQKSCRQAADEFEKAIKLNIYYADAYLNMAMTYILNAVTKEDYGLSTNMIDKSLETLEKSALIYPYFKTSEFDKAVSAIKNSEFQAAYDLLVKVREGNKDRQRQEKAAHFHRFLMFTDWLNEGNIDKKIAHLEMQLEKNPGYVDLYHELAVCHLHRAKYDWKKGIEYFKKGLKINSDLKKSQRAIDLAEGQFLKLNDAIYDITGKES